MARDAVAPLQIRSPVWPEVARALGPHRHVGLGDRADVVLGEGVAVAEAHAVEVVGEDVRDAVRVAADRRLERRARVARGAARSRLPRPPRLGARPSRVSSASDAARSPNAARTRGNAAPPGGSRTPSAVTLASARRAVRRFPAYCSARIFAFSRSNSALVIAPGLAQLLQALDLADRVAALAALAGRRRSPRQLLAEPLRGLGLVEPWRIFADAVRRRGRRRSDAGPLVAAAAECP